MGDVATIVDSGLSNCGSIANMLSRLGHGSRIATTADDLVGSKRLILPGVGSFDHGMRALANRGLIDPIRRMALDDGIPLLGICLGMQLLGRRSEEGTLPGLGLLPFESVRFTVPTDSSIRIPHMGWNEVTLVPDRPLATSLGSGRWRFYFVHTYHARCEDDGITLATAVHGYPFAAAVGRGTILGTQFHPEKSHRYGMRLLDAFARW